MVKELKMGAYHASECKRQNTLIVLTHHLGGLPRQLNRHVEFLNQNGFDAYTYPAFLHGKDHWKDFLPALKNRKQGVLEIWATELQDRLNHLPAGPKALFSFSFSCVSALLVIPQRQDIKALICDGGPFLDFPQACFRLITHYHRASGFFFKLCLTGKIHRAFKVRSKKVHKSLGLMPHNFPILSLRGERDQQAPPIVIDRFFRKAKNPHITVCQLKHSAHLKGLKTEREFYIKNVMDFLCRLKTAD